MSDTLQTILTRAEQQHAELNTDIEFQQTLLQQSAEELCVVRLTVWTQTSRMIAQTGDSSLPPPSTHDLSNLAHGEVCVLQHDKKSTSTGGGHLLAGAVVAGDVRLVLDVVESQQSVDQEILIPLADVFADLQRRRMLESHLYSSQHESAWQAVIAQVHASLDSSVIANTIATDVAAILSCRRIAVGRRRGKCRVVVATTGVSQPNERSDAARQIIQSIEAAATGDSNVIDNQTNNGETTLRIQRLRKGRLGRRHRSRGISRRPAAAGTLPDSCIAGTCQQRCGSTEFTDERSAAWNSLAKQAGQFGDCQPAK